MDGLSGVRALERLLRPLRTRVALMVSRAVVRLVDDAVKMQALQVTALSKEVMGEIERFQEYGFTSHPLAGAEAVLLSVGGNRNHGVIVSVDDRRHRPKDLEPGETKLYDWLGKFLHFRADGTAHLKTPRALVETTGDTEVQAGGQVVINAGGDVTITAGGKVVVDAATTIELAGEGGPAVARVGDLVAVGTGSSAGQWPIQSGSPKVRAN